MIARLCMGRQITYKRYKANKIKHQLEHQVRHQEGYQVRHQEGYQVGHQAGCQEGQRGKEKAQVYLLL